MTDLNDTEAIEIFTQKVKHIQNSGYIDFDHYERHRRAVIGGLRVYGDRFSRSLAEALNEADLYDSIKIMRYWNHLCEQMALMFKMKEAKEKVA